MNVASAASFLSDEFETEILLSKNALVFLHGLDPNRPFSWVLSCKRECCTFMAAP
jgi:hypothetical protein